MGISITTLFDDFFKYQPIDLQNIAVCFKKNKFDFVDTTAFLCVCFNLDTQGIMYEFIKALAYKICVINGTLEKAR